MARAKITEKLETVAGAVTPGTKAALEDYRWAAHKTQSQVVREAVEFFVTAKKLKVVEPVPEPVTDAEDTAPTPDA